LILENSGFRGKLEKTSKTMCKSLKSEENLDRSGHAAMMKRGTAQPSATALGSGGISSGPAS